MTKHTFTPGPWSTGCFVDDSTPCQCKYIFSEGYAGSVAEISVDNGKRIGDGGNDCPPLEEAKANARLIAAAPDLLDALEKALPLLEGFEEGDAAMREDDEEPIVKPVIDQARAALTKALGQED